MDYITFTLGALYVTLALIEAWRFLKRKGVAATIERFKEAIMVSIGSLYMLHSGLIDVIVGSSARVH